MPVPVQTTLLATILCFISTMAFAAEMACPTQTSEPPSITATGPYLITGFGTTEAIATGLPNCESAQYHAVRMVDAVETEVMAVITLANDNAYIVTLVTSK